MDNFELEDFDIPNCEEGVTWGNSGRCLRCDEELDMVIDDLDFCEVCRINLTVNKGWK